MLRKVSPDPERAQSLLRLAKNSLVMIETLDKVRFTTNIVKEYYEVARELIAILLLLDGYKASGEGAHAQQIVYLRVHYPEFHEPELALLEELRIIRNEIAYEGFTVSFPYLKQNEKQISILIGRLQKFVTDRLSK